MKKTKIILIILSIISILGLSAFLFATNYYEEKLQGVWINDKLNYGFLLKEDNKCDVIEPQTYVSYNDIKARATYTAGFDLLWLTTYINDEKNENKFKYNFMYSFSLSKSSYDEKKVIDIVQNSEADGYIDRGFIQLNDKYVVYVIDEQNTESRKKYKAVKEYMKKNNIDFKDDISRNNLLKVNLLETNKIELPKRIINNKLGKDYVEAIKDKKDKEFILKYYEKDEDGYSLTVDDKRVSRRDKRKIVEILIDLDYYISYMLRIADSADDLIKMNTN